VLGAPVACAPCARFQSPIGGPNSSEPSANGEKPAFTALGGAHGDARVESEREADQKTAAAERSTPARIPEHVVEQGALIVTDAKADSVAADAARQGEEERSRADECITEVDHAEATAEVRLEATGATPARSEDRSSAGARDESALKDCASFAADERHHRRKRFVSIRLQAIVQRRKVEQTRPDHDGSDAFGRVTVVARFTLLVGFRVGKEDSVRRLAFDGVRCGRRRRGGESAARLRRCACCRWRR
jgi:hypothetical protein